MKSNRFKMLALAGAGMFMLQAASCTPIQMITDLLSGLLPSA